jgi:hypothetical protein
MANFLLPDGKGREVETASRKGCENAALEEASLPRGLNPLLCFGEVLAVEQDTDSFDARC